MTFMIWGISAVMTLNVKVAQATHEAPFSPRGRRVGEEGETVMTFMIRGVSTVMTVSLVFCVIIFALGGMRIDSRAAILHVFVMTRLTP